MNLSYLKVESKWQYFFRLLFGVISCILVIFTNDFMNSNLLIWYGFSLVFTCFCISCVELYTKNYFEKLCVKRRNDMKEKDGHIDSRMKFIVIFMICILSIMLPLIVLLDFIFSGIFVTIISKILFFITNKQVWVVLAYGLGFLISYFIGVVYEIVAFEYFAFKHSEYDNKTIIEE